MLGLLGLATSDLGTQVSRGSWSRQYSGEYCRSSPPKTTERTASGTFQGKCLYLQGRTEAMSRSGVVSGS